MSGITKAAFLKDGVVFYLETLKGALVAYLDDLRDFSGCPVIERWSEGRLQCFRVGRLVFERQRQGRA